MDEIERDQGGEEAPDRDESFVIGHRCQRDRYCYQHPEDPDLPVAGEEQRYQDNEAIKHHGRDRYVDVAAIGGHKIVEDGVFSHRNRHPLGMVEHDRINRRARESTEYGATGKDPFAQLFELACLVSFNQVAAQR